MDIKLSNKKIDDTYMGIYANGILVAKKTRRGDHYASPGSRIRNLYAMFTEIHWEDNGLEELFGVRPKHGDFRFIKVRGAVSNSKILSILKDFQDSQEKSKKTESSVTTAMSKDQVIKFLEKAGIWVKDGKIAKADAAKAKEAMARYKAEAELKGSISKASTEEELKKMVESLNSEASEDILSDLSIKTIYANADKEDLYWDAVALLDMMDSQYMYVSTSVDGESVKHVFKKSDIPSILEALKGVSKD